MAAKCLSSILVATVVFATASGSYAQDDWDWPEKPENLKVLPKEWPGTRLRPVMFGFTRALGVRCSHCHVGEEGAPLSTYDFPSDDNPRKNVARAMLTMLGDINEHLKEIEPSGNRVNMWCHTCHRGRPRPTTLSEEMLETYEKDGTAETVALYRTLREQFYGRGSYDFGEGGLNQFGYQLLGEGDSEAAIAIFKLNIEMYPESGNVYDSLAETYMSVGQNDLAIEFYEKALEKNPDNEGAREKIEQLRGTEH